MFSSWRRSCTLWTFSSQVFSQWEITTSRITDGLVTTTIVNKKNTLYPYCFSKISPNSTRLPKVEGTFRNTSKVSHFLSKYNSSILLTLDIFLLWNNSFQRGWLFIYHNIWPLQIPSPKGSCHLALMVDFSCNPSRPLPPYFCHLFDIKNN